MYIIKMACEKEQKSLDDCDRTYGKGTYECDPVWYKLEECRKQNAGKRRSRKGGRKSRKSRKGGKKSRKSRK